MRQVLSHYQAIIPNNSVAFDLSHTIGIEGVIDLLNTYVDDKEVASINEQLHFFVPIMVMFEEDLIGAVGTIRFSREYHLFPTMEEHQLGAIVSYLGKEFILFYDSELRLNIGYNGSLYCFEDSKTYHDDAEIIYSVCCEQIDFNTVI